MKLNRRLLIAPLRIVIILTILAIGAFIYNRWSPQPVNSPLSAGSSQGSLADDPLVYLPDTGLVQLTTPVTSISYYVRNLNNLGTLGFNIGDSDWKTAGTQDHLVILDYGRPIVQGDHMGQNYSSIAGKQYLHQILSLQR